MRDVLPRFAEDALQDANETKVASWMGAGRWVDSTDRSRTPNRARTRTMSIPAVDVEV